MKKLKLPQNQIIQELHNKLENEQKKVSHYRIENNKLILKIQIMESFVNNLKRVLGELKDALD